MSIAYCSHSYRPEDRAINIAVWDRLNANGLAFAVDPPSLGLRAMDVTFLERMLQRSHCFVAIVPNRPQLLVPESGLLVNDGSTWSPYQTLECRLALRVNKPMMIIVERRSDRGPLPHGHIYLSFERSDLTLSANFDRELEKFSAEAGARARAQERDLDTLPEAGLLRWKPLHPGWDRLTTRIKDVLGDNCEVFDVDATTQDHRILMFARRFSLIVADVNPAVTPPSLIALLHGAGIPLYRMCHLEPEQSPETEILSELRFGLLHGYRIDARMRPVLFWKSNEISAAAATAIRDIGDYRARERQLATPTSAREYFLSLQGNRIFISTPAQATPFTERVKLALDDAGMPAFHYTISPMKAGVNWRAQLRDAVQASNLVVGFITEDFWDREECVAELTLAVERWERHELLIVLYCIDSLPDSPPFLLRSQIPLIKETPEACRAIVAELRGRLERNTDEPPPDIMELLVGLVQKHVPLIDANDLARWLGQTCHIDAAEAQRLAERAFAGKGGVARELVHSLVATVPVERYRGAALGRLCYFLRKMDPEKRDAINSLFSILRLFPNLHDIPAWNMRRKRIEVELRFKHGTPHGLLAVATSGAGQHEDTIVPMQQIGADIATHIEIGQHGDLLRQPDTRIVFSSNVEHLDSPVEWAVLEQVPSGPIARLRPIHRRVETSSASGRRGTFETAFHNGFAGPPRILLFGHGGGDLPAVATELETLTALLTEAYTRVQWPVELIQRIPFSATTAEELALWMMGSDFDIAHFAGHVGFTARGQPAIQVAGDDGKPAFVTGEQLGQWLRPSSVRFVHISGCAGASADPKSTHLAGWRQTLCKDLLEAGVTEVLAHLWEVGDRDSVAFSRLFYDAYVPSFDAPGALFRARQNTGRSNALWASSILVRQATS
jgi:hypothetical protein